MNATLMCAAYYGKHWAAVLLLRRGACCDAPNRYGNTPLMWAVIRDHALILRLLVGYGADVNFVGQDGWTALHWAVQRARPAMAQYLVQSGARLDIKNDVGLTPSMLLYIPNDARRHAKVWKRRGGPASLDECAPFSTPRVRVRDL
jgi:ankyrin repeat protein